MLTVPLEEMDVPKYYGQHILKLFVTAQQLGTVVAYPSGRQNLAVVEKLLQIDGSALHIVVQIL